MIGALATAMVGFACGAVAGWVGGRLTAPFHLALLRRRDRARRARGEVGVKNLIRHPLEQVAWLPGGLVGAAVAPWGLGVSVAVGALLVPGLVLLLLGGRRP